MVLGYRAVLSLIGCYVTARLAPSNPMAHALSLGVIGADDVRWHQPGPLNCMNFPNSSNTALTSGVIEC
jgi:hypothetical protein